MLTRLARIGGICVVILAAVIVVSWHLHFTAAIRLSPTLPSLKYNSAVTFIISGLGVVLLTSRYRRWVVLVAIVIVSMGAGVLVEYLSGVQLGIDEMIVDDYILPATAFPGRMSPLTACCFICVGIGLGVAAGEPDRTWRTLTLGVFACVVSVVAVVALIGFAVGNPAAYGWGNATSVSLPMAILFLILGLSLMLWVIQISRSDGIRVLQWLPITIALVLVAMVTNVAALSFSQLKLYLIWREHTYEVLLKLQSTLADVLDVQRGMRGIVLTGKPDAFETYNSGVRSLRKELAELSQLTHDDVSQHERLKVIDVDVERMINYSRGVLSVRESQGMQAVIKVESTGIELVVINSLLEHLQAFADEAKRLLVVRDTLSHDEFRKSALLVVSSIASAGLLLGLAMIMANREIGRRRQGEIQLQNVLSVQSAILDSANYAIVSITKQGAIASFNKTAERWFGWSAQEVIGKPIMILWYNQDRLSDDQEGQASQLTFENLVAQASENHSDEREWTLARKDGKTISSQVSMTAIRDAHGETSGYLGVISDLTERNKRQSELRLSEERYRILIDGVIDHAIYQLDPQGRVVLWSAGAQRLTHFRSEEIMGEHLSHFYTSEACENGEPAKTLKAAERNGTHRSEGWRTRKDGSSFWADTTVHSLLDEDSKLLGFVTLTYDASVRHDIERLKNEFVAMVSHELRTPLTSIRGSLGLIKGGALGLIPAKAQTMVRIALQNCERLIRIINDILDVEKMRAGKLELHLSAIPIAEFLSSALEANQGFAEKFNVRFILEKAPAEIRVLADPDRLMQVLTNLLSNAAKFSPEVGGNVIIRATALTSGQLRVEVEDYGLGIPMAFRSQVFEKFAKADSSAARRLEGTGLGLNISRELVLAMGGTIGFDSVVGGGTRFFFEVPQYIDKLLDANAEPPPRFAVDFIHTETALSLPRILYVEADADLVSVIQAAVADRAQILVATTTLEARRLLKEEHFALIILDPWLSGGNAFSLLDELHASPSRSVPVMILSAREVSDQTQRRAALSLVKSHTSEDKIVRAILSFIYPKPNERLMSS